MNEVINMQNSNVGDINTVKSSVGIEIGSTRIKTVLIDSNANILASGSFTWENSYIDGIWTYSLEEVWKGVQESYLKLKENVYDDYGVLLKEFGSIGISAMMHGYLVFDSSLNLLVPYRTWRNTMTSEAVLELSSVFNQNIPQRWSIAHLYQAILNNEDHISKISFITTLSGYVHWKLTGEKNIGIGDASGMFPIDYNELSYNRNEMDKFNLLCKKQNVEIDIESILPSVLVAGDRAGYLTKEGSLLLDPEGDLNCGIPFAPCEGDAGTGMVATNSIRANTGNVSAGTSVFAMIVLEKKLESLYSEIDIVTTPEGLPTAMIHVNNCSSEINSWLDIFREVLELFDCEVEDKELYRLLYKISEESDKDSMKILSYGYHSGEHITKFAEGRPLLVRTPGSKFKLANFMKAQIMSAFATLSIGMNILFKEGIRVENVVGHGGVFSTEKVAQTILASAIESPVSVLKTSNEGGAWGMALLAQYSLCNKLSLEEYLERVFEKISITNYVPSLKEIENYREYIRVYKLGLNIEESAIRNFEGIEYV